MRASLYFSACVLALAGCGQTNLAPAPGVPSLSALAQARPDTLHVVPLHSFTFAESYIGKSGGAGLIGDPKVGLFGVAPEGGDTKCQDGHKGCGFVYELVPRPRGNSYAEKRLYTFHGMSGKDGAEPSAALIVGEKGTGVLYGTTVLGGSYGKGTVFRLTPTLTPYVYKERVLYSFGGTKDDGNYPYSSLIEMHRTLYGTTSAGGTYDKGVAFGVSVSGTPEQTLHSFGGSRDGAAPYASLIDVDGTFYGTTSAGGSRNCGTVFSLTAAGAERVLHRFQGSPDGCNPLGSGVVEVGGVLYGTTSLGGGMHHHIYCGCGTIYSVSTTGSERVLHSFAGHGSPTASLVDVTGVLYGTTFYGGKCRLDPNGCGVAFSMGASGSPPYQVQFTFTGTLAGGGAEPAAALLANGGNFYGTSTKGGEFGHGEAFELSP